MITQEKIEELANYPASKFNTYELQSIENMEGQEEFSERQIDFIDELYNKHFGKDDGKL